MNNLCALFLNFKFGGTYRNQVLKHKNPIQIPGDYPEQFQPPSHSLPVFLTSSAFLFLKAYQSI
jgi:hypothetical protein